MANTSARMLRLLSLLQTHRFWPGAHLADRLEVSPRTLRRDVDRLRELGYPVDASRGVAGGYQLQAGGAVPPLLLDDDEAVAIAVGLQTAAGSVGSFGGDDIEETSVRALAKVIQLLPPRLRRRIDALRAVSSPGIFGGGPVIAPDTLTTIALACRGEERLRFAYTAREGDSTSRYVEPHRLVSLGRRWYLVAWDLDRADWRSFRVDRVTSPAPTGVHFRLRDIPGGDPVTWLRSRLTNIPSRYEVSVLVALPPDQVRRTVGHYGTVEALPATQAPAACPGAGSTGGDARLPGARGTAGLSGNQPAGPRDSLWCRLRMNVDDLTWPVMVLGAMDAPFTVEAPPELLDRVRDVATSLLRHADPLRHAGTPGPPPSAGPDDYGRIGAPVAPIRTSEPTEWV